MEEDIFEDSNMIIHQDMILWVPAMMRRQNPPNLPHRNRRQKSPNRRMMDTELEAPWARVDPPNLPPLNRLMMDTGLEAPWARVDPPNLPRPRLRKTATLPVDLEARAKGAPDLTDLAPAAAIPVAARDPVAKEKEDLDLDPVAKEKEDLAPAVATPEVALARPRRRAQKVLAPAGAIPAAALALPRPRAARAPKDPVLLRVVLTAKKKDPRAATMAPVAPPAREVRAKAQVAKEDRDLRLAGSKKERAKAQVAKEDRHPRLVDTKKERAKAQVAKEDPDLRLAGRKEERAKEDPDLRLAGRKEERAKEDREPRLADTKKHPPKLPLAMDTKC
jgi:hypothetical protein